jgi:hypothetical protein
LCWINKPQIGSHIVSEFMLTLGGKRRDFISTEKGVSGVTAQAMQFDCYCNTCEARFSDGGETKAAPFFQRMVKDVGSTMLYSSIIEYASRVAVFALSHNFFVLGAILLSRLMLLRACFLISALKLRFVRQSCKGAMPM